MAKLLFGNVPITFSLAMTSSCWIFFSLCFWVSHRIYPMPQVMSPECRRKLGEHIFFFLISPWDYELSRKRYHWGLFLRVAAERCGTTATTLSKAERANHESRKSPLKKWLWWMLSIDLSGLHAESAWLIWPDFACEQRLWVANCPLQRWLQP